MEQILTLCLKRQNGKESSCKEHLPDTNTKGDEVFMGTPRWERERAEPVASEVAVVVGKLKYVSPDAEEAVLEVRAKLLQVELVSKKVEKTLLMRATESWLKELSQGCSRMRALRGGDRAVPRRKKTL